MDHRAKLEWAEQHYGNLNNSVGEFIASQPYELRTDHFPEERKCRCRVRKIKPIPAFWSLMVGDIVHNVRSSLDSLVYSLARENSGIPTGEEVRKIQFPICDNPGFFNAERKRRLSQLSEEAKAKIDNLQQYRASMGGERHALTVLRDISNVDKHRHIVLTYAVIEVLNVSVQRPGRPTAFYRGSFRGPFDEQTILLEFPTEAGESHYEMDVKHLTGIDLAFAGGAPGYGKSVRPALMAAIDYVRDRVFVELEPLL